MSSTPVHMMVGALAGAAPDVVLLAIAPHRRWLPRDHPLVRAHAWLHRSPVGLCAAVALAWGSHMVLDRYTRHRTPTGTRERRGWDW